MPRFTLLVASIVLICLVAPAPDAAAGSANAQRATIDAWADAWNTGGDHVERFLTTDATYRGPVYREQGRDAYRRLIATGRTVFRNVHLAIEELILEGDRGAVSWTITGTHNTLGKAVELQGASILRFDDNLIASELRIYDMGELARQLGGSIQIPDGEGDGDNGSD